MGTYISPEHYIQDGEDIGSPRSWSLEYKIDIFYARTDGWHLKIADRCINGWVNEDGIQAINTIHHEGHVHYIPDSAWAVLQIVLYYFETIGYFKYFDQLDRNGRYRNGKSFKIGIADVFPEFKDQDTIKNILWTDLRNGLYHTGVNKSRVRLLHTTTTKPISYDTNRYIVIVDPHKLILKLREHLNEYVELLRKPNEQILRQNFENGFNSRYTE